MKRRVLLGLLFSAAAGLFYYVSPSAGCGVTSTCYVNCYTANLHLRTASCTDSTRIKYGGSCECYTAYDHSGFGYCHSHCSSTTGQDTFCSYL
jgi:hypothetical protein